MSHTQITMKKTLFTLFLGIFAFALVSCDSAKKADGGDDTKTENATGENGKEVKEEPKTVNYSDDYEAIKTAILRGQEEELGKYANLGENMSLKEFMSLFDDAMMESLENSSYASAIDVEDDGKKMKEVSVLAKYGGEEGEEEMESAVVMRFEEAAEGLRLVQYLVAG